jgi:hypothetical protein
VSVLGVEAAETASKLLLSLSPVLFLMILLDTINAGIRSVLGDGVRRGVPEKWEKRANERAWGIDMRVGA